MTTMTFPGLKIKMGLLLLLSFAVSAVGQTTGASSPEANTSLSTLASLPLPVFGALGSLLAQNNNLAELGLTEEQKKAFLDGVNAAFHGKGYAIDDTVRQAAADMAKQIQQLEERKKQQAVEAFSKPGRMAQYMKEMRKLYTLEISDSGLAYRIRPGRDGVRPRPGDTVVISCQAISADGTTKLEQLSKDHLRTKLENLLPGLIEGFQMMTVDSEAMFILPPTLSFGESEWPKGVDRGTPLVFLVTLNEVIAAETAP